MVQGFARQSGGDVRATSTLGQGARFEIWLPQIPAAKPVVGVAPVAKPIRAGHVLLVDDSRDVLLTVQTMLLKGGFTIESAFQPRDALALIAAGRRFDLLLTDYMMPELNGVALLRECRKFQPDLRALIISGYADATNFMADLPNAAFLSKPFDRRTLVARVGEMIADDWDPIAG
jgi:DNA-binding NtrC family response regulator